MDLHFLIILIVLVLYFIIKQHKRDCIECKVRFVIILGLVLGLYECYMQLSYIKLETTNNKKIKYI
jgi:hypothetical protein